MTPARHLGAETCVKTPTVFSFLRVITQKMGIFVKNVKNCKIHKYSSVNNFFLFVQWKKRKYESDAEFHEDFENHHHLSDLLN